MTDETGQGSDAAVRSYYDDPDVDASYDALWGGEDIHIGIYTDPQDDVAAASRRTVERTAAQVSDLLGPEARVLDLGSGYGGSSRALAGRFGCRVAALDLSEEHNRRHHAANTACGLDKLIDVTTGTLFQIPYPDNHFDVVWSLEVLTHCPDRARALREAVRVLRPGGALVFSDIMAAEETPAELLLPAISRLGLTALTTPSYYRAQLAELGFSSVDFTDLTGHIVTHYVRLNEEMQRRAAELSQVISPAYLDHLRNNLPQWRDITRRDLLRWGIFHARNTA